MSEYFTIQTLLIIYHIIIYNIVLNNKICESILCTKLILIHVCAFVAKVITYISLHFLNTGDI